MFHMGVKLKSYHEQRTIIRRISEPKAGEVSRWRKAHIYILYCSPKIKVVKLMKKAGCVECMGERNTYRILVTKPEGKRHSGTDDTVLKWTLQKHRVSVCSGQEL
jgi:hypothetical protein